MTVTAELPDAPDDRATMVTVGIVACWGPARHSLHINPVVALRAE